MYDVTGLYLALSHISRDTEDIRHLLAQCDDVIDELSQEYDFVVWEECPDVSEGFLGMERMAWSLDGESDLANISDGLHKIYEEISSLYACLLEIRDELSGSEEVALFEEPEDYWSRYWEEYTAYWTQTPHWVDWTSDKLMVPSHICF